MEQLELFDIPTPCRNVCQANAKGYCTGCYRTRDERFYWQQLSNSQKRDVLKACRIRRYLDHRARKTAQTTSISEPENLSLF